MTSEPICGNADTPISEVNNSLLAIIPMSRCADQKFTIENVNFYKYSMCLCGKIGLLKRVVNILHLLPMLSIMVSTTAGLTITLLNWISHGKVPKL